MAFAKEPTRAPDCWVGSFVFGAPWALHEARPGCSVLAHGTPLDYSARERGFGLSGQITRPTRQLPASVRKESMS